MSSEFSYPLKDLRVIFGKPFCYFPTLHPSSQIIIKIKGLYFFTARKSFLKHFPKFIKISHSRVTNRSLPIWHSRFIQLVVKKYLHMPIIVPNNYDLLNMNLVRGNFDQ